MELRSSTGQLLLLYAVELESFAGQLVLMYAVELKLSGQQAGVAVCCGADVCLDSWYCSRLWN